ncbi:MAG: LD-carboxypeptidase [Bacteroidota bacterium]
MIHPPYLVKGDKIGIVSPARSITFDEIHPAIRFFQKHDLEVVLGTHVFSKHNQFAGTDAQRCRDMQQMLDDESIRAVICSRGGYGTTRIIDGLDFTKFHQYPKWIVGYSDITVLHAHIHRKLGIETLHATMPVNIRSEKSDETLQTMMNALCGIPIAYSYPKPPLSREGSAEGLLVGGNLSILHNLEGTASELDTNGKILFLEDIEEYLYHIDRMMVNLNRAGKLAGLKGLIVGGMTKMNDNAVPFGKSAVEIIADAVKDYRFPVCTGFPAGHLDTNLALIMGRHVRLRVGKEVELEFLP